MVRGVRGIYGNIRGRLVFLISVSSEVPTYRTFSSETDFPAGNLKNRRNALADAVFGIKIGCKGKCLVFHNS